LIGFTENLVNNDHLSRLLTNHDYFMLLYKLIINITNTVSYQGLGSVGLTFVSLTNLLFNIILVSNFVTYLPFYNLSILKVYGMLGWGLLYANLVYFIHEFIGNFTTIRFPTAGVILMGYPIVLKFGCKLIENNLVSLTSLDPSKERNHLKIIKVN
jgi:hypothetical protein